MGTLFIDRKDLYVKLDGNTLAFYVNGKKEGSVPITPLKRVVIVGNITLEANVLSKLASENISVIFLSGKNLRFCGMLHGSLHNNAIIRIRQYEKSKTSFAREFALNIVTHKIRNQINFLKDLIELRQDLRSEFISTIKVMEGIEKNIFERKPDIESLRGYEGSSASAYFSAFTKIFPPSLNFEGRNKRPPQDPVNAMLSLCYTILHFEMVREIELNGLDPTVGFYHSFEYGRESLACDFVEPFRIEADRFVWELFRTRQFTQEDFTYEEEGSGCYLKKAGRAKFYPLCEEWRSNLRSKTRDFVRDFIRSICNEEDLVSL
ncbi:MAG: CRISPR-associated endonuclease Cas1 [Proteobacteria bacterium]|nr:CRISPR-associated endonuclease Cas1 [Pseudomonadota bacterium]